MTADRWNQIRDLAGEVLELDPPSRAAAIARVCGSDTALRAEIEKLVQSFEGIDERDWAAPVRLMEVAQSDLRPVLEPGALVAGRYRVTAQLGRGGMGEVYEAEEDGGRRVALKLVRWNRLGDLSARRRLLREGLLAQRVEHPQVCRVFEVVEHVTAETGALAVLVMERLQGETLADRLARAPRCSLHEVRRWAGQMSDALQAAHDAGVVHRDFKPSNVMLTPDRGAVVMDFGLATASRSILPAESTLTSSGVLMGTLEYMAPEQLREERASPRSDQYALAAVLFEMITGERHSQGASGVDEIVRRVTQRAPDVRQWVPEAAGWSKPLQRALAPDPDGRFATVREFVEAIDRRPRRWPWAAAAALVLALGGFWWWNRLEGLVRVGLVAEGEEVRLLASSALGLSNFYRLVPLPASSWEQAAAKEKCAFVARAVSRGSGVRITLDRLQGWRRQWECAEGSTLSRGVETCALRVRQWVGDPSLAEARYQAKLSEITTASAEAMRHYARSVELSRSRASRQDVESELMRAIEFDPQFAAAHRRLGEILDGAGDLPRAVSHYEQAIKFARTGRASLCESLYGRGLFGLDMGEYSAARAAFEENVKVCAPSPGSHFYLGATYEALGRLTDARREYEEARLLAPGERFAQVGIARVAVWQKDAPAVHRVAESLRAHGHALPANRWTAIGLQMEGRSQQARALLRKLCEQQAQADERSYGCSLLARSLAEDRRFAEALEVLLPEVVRDDDAGKRHEAAAKRVAIAWLALQAKRPEHQRAVFRAIEFGTQSKLLSQAAVVLRYMNQKEMIKQLADRIRPLKRYPRFEAALLNMEAELASDPAEGLRLVLAANRLEQVSAERVTLARMYLQAGQTGQFRETLASEPLGFDWIDGTPGLPGYRVVVSELSDKK